MANFDKKSDLLKWFGDHFVDNYTGQSAIYGILADIIKTVEIPEKTPSYSQVINMRFELQKILKKHLEKWQKKGIENENVEN